MPVSADRYFDSAKHVLEYLMDEGYEQDGTLDEALSIVEAAEEDIWEFRICDECDQPIGALSEGDLDEVMAHHMKYIHKS